jgi:hypothetical protein
MATAAYISGMQKIASLVSQKKNPVVEQRFLEFFQYDGNSGVAPDLRPVTGTLLQLSDLPVNQDHHVGFLRKQRPMTAPTMP